MILPPMFPAIRVSRTCGRARLPPNIFTGRVQSIIGSDSIPISSIDVDVEPPRDI